MANDYILTKDENGQLKYYKDGKFFDPAEIEKANHASFSNKPALPIAKILSVDSPKMPPTEIEDKFQASADKIVRALKVSFTDDILKKKFYNLIISHLRGVRSDKEVVYSLQVPKADGGIGLDDKRAQLVLAMIKKYEEPASEKSLPVKPPTASSPVFAQANAKPSAPPAPKAPVGRDGRLMPEQTKPIIPLPEDRKPQGFSRPVVRPLASASSSRPQFSDVKYEPRLLGPIDELKTLDLVNFRRLGGTPFEIIEEIEEKVALLKEENFEKGVLGVNAWKDSPVHKIYTDIGVESILTTKPISEVIIDRQVKNLPVITLSEFEAIIELNKRLGA